MQMHALPFDSQAAAQPAFKFKEIPTDRSLQICQCSSGSRNFGEGRGGPRIMKYKPPRAAAIFFLPIFYRPGRGHGTLAPPPWIRYCNGFLMIKYIFNISVAIRDTIYGVIK